MKLGVWTSSAYFPGLVAMGTGVGRRVTVLKVGAEEPLPVLLVIDWGEGGLSSLLFSPCYLPPFENSGTLTPH